jgi:DNA/RNA endonuclease YhcR with UshA esterase domain
MSALKRNRLLLLAVLGSVIGVVSLYAYATTIQAREVAIGDVGGDDVGSLVRVRGLLKDVSTTSGGSLRMVVMDPETYSTVGVFIPRDVVDGMEGLEEFVPGASLTVVGEVQEYRGRVELYVSSPRDVRVVAPAASGIMELDVLAENPETFAGMTVRVQGRLLDPEVIVDWKRYEVTDDTGSLWAYVTASGMEGEPVDVFGVLQRNEGRDRWELKVAGPADGVFSSPASVPAGYAVATVEQLLGDPGAYAGGGVAVLAANVTRGERIGTRFVLLDEGVEDTYSVEGFIFGWDYDADRRGLQAGDLVSFVGVFDYYAEGARWQIQSDEFTLET